MESNAHLQDHGRKPARYVGYSAGSWKPGLAWSEATTARHFPPPLPQRRQPGVEATGYSAAGAIGGFWPPPLKNPPPPGPPSASTKREHTLLPRRPPPPRPRHPPPRPRH